MLTQRSDEVGSSPTVDGVVIRRETREAAQGLGVEPILPYAFGQLFD
jgi:hypothetical protein